VDKKKLKEDIDQSIDKIAVNALVQSWEWQDNEKNLKK
jgi:hypothetical protein